jgi:toxin ParE1/3/4
MSDPIIAPGARADLDLIARYYADKNEVFARRVLADILSRGRLYARFPLMGESWEELGRGLRSYYVKPFVIIYRPARDTIEIVRVLRGSRDIPSILREEDLR